MFLFTRTKHGYLLSNPVINSTTKRDREGENNSNKVKKKGIMKIEMRNAFSTLSNA